MYNASCSKIDTEHSIVTYSAWFPDAHMYSWSLKFWKKGCLPCLHLLFPAAPTATGGLCGSCFYPTGSLLTCIKLCGAEYSPEKTEPGTTSGDQNQGCAQETHCFHLLVPVLYPVQDTQGTASDAVLKKRLLVMLDFTELQTGWGLWGQTALSERICSAPLLRAGALRAGCSMRVQQGWWQKDQKTNVRERQVQALHLW